MKFKKKYKTIFLDQNSEKLGVDTLGLTPGEKRNVILSPSMYWVKKVSLPVKYLRDVKKLLPSLFEDTLPKGNYSYSAYKSGDEYFIFAYEDKLILDTLAKKGISSSAVANVYFAQSELQDIEGAVNINEESSIYVKDELLVLVPSSWVKDAKDLDLDDIELSKHKVALQQYAHIVDNKSVYRISAVLLILSSLIAFEYFTTLGKKDDVLKKKGEVFAKYNLKFTMLQNRSMLKKYNNIHKQQMKIREYTSYILGIKLKGSEKLALLALKNKNLNADFSGIQKGDYKHITNMLKSKKIDFKTTLKDDTLHVEIAL